jgi:hypothetical protein
MEQISGIAALYAEFFRGCEAGISSFRPKVRTNRGYNESSRLESSNSTEGVADPTCPAPAGVGPL